MQTRVTFFIANRAVSMYIKAALICAIVFDEKLQLLDDAMASRDAAGTGQPTRTRGGHPHTRTRAQSPVPAETYEHIDRVAAAKATEEKQHELTLLEPMAGATSATMFLPRWR